MTREQTYIVHKVDVRLLPVKLTDAERDDYARQLALEVQTYDAIEIEKQTTTKMLGDKLKAQRGVLDEVARKVNKGIEDRQVGVVVMHDYQRKMVEIMRDDTNELVEQRPMTRQEYQAYVQTQMGSEN